MKEKLLITVLAALWGIVTGIVLTVYFIPRPPIEIKFAPMEFKMEIEPTETPKIIDFGELTGL